MTTSKKVVLHSWLPPRRSWGIVVEVLRLLNNTSATVFRFECVSFDVVEPSCSARCSSQMSQCVTSKSSANWSSSLDYGANGDGVESRSRVQVTEFRFFNCYYSPSFPVGIVIGFIDMRSFQSLVSIEISSLLLP